MANVADGVGHEQADGVERLRPHRSQCFQRVASHLRLGAVHIGGQHTECCGVRPLVGAGEARSPSDGDVSVPSRSSPAIHPALTR